jgi:hypothetical protein
VRYRLMANYGGSLFEAGVGPTDGDVVLFAACPPPEELGFEPATGHWRKQLRLDQVDAVWESRPVGLFRGERCMVLDDLGDRLHIGYLGHDGYKAEQLGYWQVDRGVFELVAPRAEVAEIVEQQADYTRVINEARPSPASEAEPAAASYEPPAASLPDYGAGAPTYQLREESSGVTLPVSAATPLPLEAEAMRAASASRRAPEPVPPLDLTRPTAAAAPERPARPVAGPPPTGPLPGGPEQAAPQPARTDLARTELAELARTQLARTQLARTELARTELAGTELAGAGRVTAYGSLRQRLATEHLFAELARQAGIPASSYAFGEEADGAFCLLQTPAGFEVFHAVDGAHHEVQVFTTEESACFYLFGMLAAEAVRTGRLVSMPAVAASL